MQLVTETTPAKTGWTSILVIGSFSFPGSDNLRLKCNCITFCSFCLYFSNFGKGITVQIVVVHVILSVPALFLFTTTSSILRNYCTLQVLHYGVPEEGLEGAQEGRRLQGGVGAGAPRARDGRSGGQSTGTDGREGNRTQNEATRFLAFEHL